jgi:hypothetical protein
MQQWARRYQELAQHRGALHRLERLQAYIFDGINRFGMVPAVATMPTLLQISVFLFFAGLVDFLFMDTTTMILDCITVPMFALAYAFLTTSLIVYLNCPYGSPLWIYVAYTPLFRVRISLDRPRN